MTLLLETVPLYMLFELSVLVARIVDRRDLRRATAAAAGAPPPPQSSDVL